MKEVIKISLLLIISILLVSCGDDGKSSSKFSATPTVNSNIVSDFSGFSSDNLYELANGQIWKQKSYDISYSYKTRPDAKIYKEGSKYIMEVEGMDKMIEVEELDVILDSEIVSEFSGFSSGNVFELSNGQLWGQKGYQTSYSYQNRPDVKICKDGIKNMMLVEGMDEMIEVEELKIETKSSISNDFDGFNSGNIYELTNGQEWEQTEVKIKVSIKIMPEVIIYYSGGSYKMLVEGISEPVRVRRAY